MSPASSLDWLYHLLGYSLAAAALLLLLWSLFHDRSRGRRRCPKCWYDMSGVPGLKCPECGREFTGERQLFKTRRSWRTMVPVFLVLLVSITLGPARDVWRNGWSGVPNWLLVFLPRVAPRKGLLDEINRRYANPDWLGFYTGPPRDDPPRWLESKLSRWQWRSLGNSCVSLFGSSDYFVYSWSVTNVAWSLPSPLDHVEEIRAKLTAPDLAARVDAAGCVVITAQRYNAAWNWTPGGPMCRKQCETLIPSLVALLELPQDDPSLTPYPTMQSFHRNGVSGAPPSLPRPTTTRAVARAAAADALGALGVSDPAAIRALNAAAAETDPWVAYFAKQALSQPAVDGSR